MRPNDLIKKLKCDNNWHSNFETEHFSVFARRQVLQCGRAAEPIPGMVGRPANFPHCAGFHGVAETTCRKIEALVKHIDGQYFKRREFKQRKSERRIPILLWDASYPHPLPEYEGSVSRADLAVKIANDPVTISNPCASKDSLEADFFVLIPVPNRYYWGEVRPEWLCGAIAHELFHVWSAWLGPPDLAGFLDGSPWRVLDEMMAVWAEQAWTHEICRSPMDYAADWTLQSGVSLYGAEILAEQSRPCAYYGYGYHHWPFISWLEARQPGVMEECWVRSNNGEHRDPWQCVDVALRKRSQKFALERIFGDYAGEAFTSGFLKTHFPRSDAQWYLKCVEEVLLWKATTERIEIEGQLLPLSKRAFLLRFEDEWDEPLAIELSISGNPPGFGLHLVEENAAGARGAVLTTTDASPPYEMDVEGHRQAVLVIFCARLNALAASPLGASQDLATYKFTLRIKEKVS